MARRIFFDPSAQDEVDDAKAARYPSHPGREAARVRVHVRVRFASEVEGPVLLGAGRFRGLGLLRAVGEE